MGKKDAKEMAQQRDVFVAGAEKNRLPRAKAILLFDLMEKFAGYGFNKSHAAAYALIAYQTAYLKAHAPSAFMAANLSAVMDDTDKVHQFYEDSVANGLKVLAPDINSSEYRFVPVDASTIRYGLGAVKGTGESAIAAILAARKDGPFRDLFDFCERVGKRRGLGGGRGRDAHAVDRGGGRIDEGPKDPGRPHGGPQALGRHRDPGGYCVQRGVRSDPRYCQGGRGRRDRSQGEERAPLRGRGGRGPVHAHRRRADLRRRRRAQPVRARGAPLDERRGLQRRRSRRGDAQDPARTLPQRAMPGGGALQERRRERRDAAPPGIA